MFNKSVDKFIAGTLVATNILGVSVIELLKKFGCLKGMTQSNQMSLFV